MPFLLVDRILTFTVQAMEDLIFLASGLSRERLCRYDVFAALCVWPA